MHIQRSREPIRPQRTQSQSDTSSIKGPEEDPDTSQIDWTESPIPDPPPSDHFHEQLPITGTQIQDMLGALSDSWVGTRRLKQSLFSHLTLPEALLIYHSFQDPNTPLQARLSLSHGSSDIRTLQFKFTLQGKQTQEWCLQYDVRCPQNLILSKGQKQGHFKYIIRQHRLEEIEGYFQGTHFLLDPIFGPNKNIQTEQVKIGQQQTHIQRRNQPKAQQSQALSIQIKHRSSQPLLGPITQLKKQLILPHIRFNSHLVFHPDVLMPIQGLIQVA